VERYHVPNYLRARCIFFEKFLRGQEEWRQGLEPRILLHGAHVGCFYGMESRRNDDEHIFATRCKV
jgi:hypothetical protein